VVSSDDGLDPRTVVMILLSVSILTISILIFEPTISNPYSNYDSQVENLFEDVLVGLKNMRELQDQTETDLRIVSIQWFIDQEKEKVLEQSEEINLQDIVYKALFLIPEEYSVSKSRVEQAGRILSAVAGNRLYIVREYFDPEEINPATRTLAHEITHLLQSEFKTPPLRTFDQRQAWISIIEGDADFTADMYISIASGPLRYLSPVSESIDKIKSFPYQYGSGFISTVFDKGGWSMVNSVYEEPPSSTEEILHSQVYFAEEESFIKLDPLFPESDEWKRILTDTYGEYFIRIMLEKWIESDESFEAARGWGGDTLSLFQNNGDYLVTWRINWDSARDSNEFYDAYQQKILVIGAEEVENGLYKTENYYISIVKSDKLTEIAISKSKLAISSIQN
jgi:hypothetical protein